MTLRRPPSLALRLTVSIGVGITLLLLCFGWLVERSINEHFVHQDLSELSAVHESIAGVIASKPDKDSSDYLKRGLREVAYGHRSVEFLLADAAGSIVYATPEVDLTPLIDASPRSRGIDQETMHLWENGGKTYRVGTLGIDSGFRDHPEPYVLVLATDIDFHLHYLSSFHDYLRWLTAAACLIAIVAIWLAVYQGHAPIRRISRQISRINSQQLHIRLESTNTPVELMPLTTAFNEMIDRLEEGFRRLSNFSDDIAHELRTPITSLTTQTQVALSKDRAAHEYREVLYSSLEELERMGKMVGGMLFLAKAENHLIMPECSTVPVAEEIAELFEFFEAWADERGVKLILHGGNATVYGDRSMLRRAFSNLLSNAIRHTPQDQGVEVAISDEGPHVIITFKNPGPTIAPEHLEHVFERFYRPDASRHRNGEGVGLGLAIVHSIVKVHGGSISVTSESGITAFEVRLEKTAASRAR